MGPGGVRGGEGCGRREGKAEEDEGTGRMAMGSSDRCLAATDLRAVVRVEELRRRAVVKFVKREVVIRHIESEAKPFRAAAAPPEDVL